MNVEIFIDSETNQEGSTYYFLDTKGDTLQDKVVNSLDELKKVINNLQDEDYCRLVVHVSKD